MELLQLRYFYESAKTESFAHTAEKYMVPPTSVSASVKRLEKELGCTLFDRASNRIKLNNNGRKLKQSLNIIFRELDHVVDSLSVAKQDSREIRILVRSVRRIVTNIITVYKSRHPQLLFRTYYDFTATDLENYDIIIDDDSEPFFGYESFELCCTRIRMKCARSNPICRKKVTIRELRNEPFVCMDEHSDLHKLLLRACHDAGFTPNVAAICNDLSCYNKLLQSGIGIGLGREIKRGGTEGDTMYLDVVDFNVYQHIMCYYKKQADYGNIHNFLNFLRSQNIQENFI